MALNPQDVLPLRERTALDATNDDPVPVGGRETVSRVLMEVNVDSVPTNNPLGYDVRVILEDRMPGGRWHPLLVMDMPGQSSDVREAPRPALAELQTRYEVPQAGQPVTFETRVFGV